jgi:hypothetical protein
MQNIESELSYAYLHAIASRAGIICEYVGRHSDAAGVDAVLRVKGRLDPNSSLTQFTIDVQLKATKKVPVERAGRYSHSLEVKNYDELRSIDVGAPQLLVVLFLPDDVEAWLVHDEEGLVSRRCAYWLSLHGAPGTDRDSKTVYVPRANMLSVNRLLELMTRYSKGEVIGYEP